MTVLSLYVVYWARGGNLVIHSLGCFEWNGKARNGLTIWYELITNIMDSSFITAGSSRLYNCMAKSIHRKYLIRNMLFRPTVTHSDIEAETETIHHAHTQLYFAHRRTRKKKTKNMGHENSFAHRSKWKKLWQTQAESNTLTKKQRNYYIKHYNHNHKYLNSKILFKVIFRYFIWSVHWCDLHFLWSFCKCAFNWGAK